MLEIKKEDLGNSRVKLTVHIPSVLMKGYFDEVYNKLAPNVEVKGFRKGAAPKSLAIASMGESFFMQEIINAALSDSYVKALEKEQLMPVSMPQVNVKMMKDLTTENGELEYEVEVDLMPEVEIGDYKKIKIKQPKEKVEVKDEEIEKVISHLQRQHATFEEVDREAKKGDRIEVDFEGSERGVVLDQFTSKNYPFVIGSGVLIPEFEKKVEGIKKGESREFDLNVEVPVASGKKEKKKIHFKVKCSDIKKVNLPDADDEFAKKFEQPTIEDLKRAIGVDILKQKEIAQRKEKENQVVQELLKITKINLPESLVEQEIHRMIDELRAQTSMAGVPFEQYLGQLKKTEEDLHTDFKEQAENTVKMGLILGEIGKKEKVDLKDKEAGHRVMEKLIEYAEK